MYIPVRRDSDRGNYRDIATFSNKFEYEWLGTSSQRRKAGHPTEEVTMRF